MRTASIRLALLPVLLAGCASDVPSGPSLAAPLLERGSSFLDVIALPTGFSPEGITFGRGTTFYVGSIPTGAIFRGDARTGTGHIFIAGQAGREAIGVKYDQRLDRLFVAGGDLGEAFVYDAATGATLATYALSDPTAGPTDINDLVVLHDAVYFTDDARAVLYRLPLAANGALPPAAAVQTIPLTGDFQLVPGGINANGIVATPGERWLIVVNTTTGILYRVEPTTGQTTAIELGGGSVPGGDGLVLIGHTLYVAEGPAGQVAVVRLSSDFTLGDIDRTITSASLDFPSTIAAFGDALYAVNARFEALPGPDVPYEVVRLSR